MKAKAPICVQIAALGGQGGGVLAEWMAEAARAAGYPAQVTSIPGVAQRTGATTYYFEMYPDVNPPAKPVFSLFPDADGLDMMVAMEPLEAARALDLGLITERTTVLAAGNRIYSTAEKSVAGDGAIAPDTLFGALEGAAGRVIRLDMDALASVPGAPANGVMFGAMAASGILPIPKQNFEDAIRQKGVAVDPNLRDFAAGLSQNGDGNSSAGTGGQTHEPAPSELSAEIEPKPEHLKPILGHVCARLTDYQDTEYARRFLIRMKPFEGAGEGLGVEVARRLGAWMSYEDVIRVAQLKTRPGRLRRIRGEVRVDDGGVLSVTEFLKPGREELASLMPPVLGRWLMKNHNAKSVAGLKLRLPTTRFYGYAALKFLAGLKKRRRKTYRYQAEQAAIDTWLRAVESTMDDEGFALQVAELAVLARGYGGVRARGMEKLDQLFRHWGQKQQDGMASLRAEVETLLHQARHDPDRDCR